MSELGSETNALLRKARQGTPELPPAVRSRLRSAVMTGAGLSTVAAGVSFAKVIAIGVVSASFGAVTTLAVTKLQRAPPTPPPALVVPVVETEPPVEPAPAVPLALLTTHGETPIASRADRRPGLAPPAPVPPPEEVVPEAPRVDERSLAAELETLEGILRATDGAHWADARLRLGAYFARFENGHLQIEARALEVLTLCGEGHVEAAQALRQELLRVEPLNPAVLRLSSSCAN